MKRIFAFCNQKGGVGKTTTTINLGTILAQNGYRVLILDMDSQGNATSGLGSEKPGLEFTTYQLLVDNEKDDHNLIRQTEIPNLFLIPASAELVGADLELFQQERREFRLREKLRPLAENFDFVLMDCPPSLGLVTLNCLTSSDYIIIPLQCEYYALEGLGQLIQTYQLVQQKLNSDLQIGGVLLTMADLRTNLTQQVIEEVRKYFKEQVFETIIPRSVKLSEAPSFGKPAVIYDPHNRGSKAYWEVAREFERRFAAASRVSENPTATEAPRSEVGEGAKISQEENVS